MAANTIIVLGDSLSTAHGFDTSQGWVNLLQNKLNQPHPHTKIVNMSITGATTSNGLQRLPKILRQYKPKIVIIELGGNDGLRGLKIITIKKNLNQMIRISQAAHSKVLILGIRLPPNLGIYAEQFQKIFTNISASKDVQVIPQFLLGIDENLALFSEDGIHPNATAQPIIVKTVWPVLQKML